MLNPSTRTFEDGAMFPYLHTTIDDLDSQSNSIQSSSLMFMWFRMNWRKDKSGDKSVVLLVALLYFKAVEACKKDSMLIASIDSERTRLLFK